MIRFRLRTILSFVALSTLSALLVVESIRSMPPSWESYSPERLTGALKSGRIVLVTFSADWDATCYSHEKPSINSLTSYRALRSNGIVTLRADYTHFDPSVVELMKKNGISTVPAFAMYSPKAPDVPVILRDLVSEAHLIEAINYARM